MFKHLVSTACYGTRGTFLDAHDESRSSPPDRGRTSGPSRHVVQVLPTTSQRNIDTDTTRTTSRRRQNTIYNILQCFANYQTTHFRTFISNTSKEEY